MTPFINSISINVFDGAFKETIAFKYRLNLLSGVNGSGKTTILRKIKNKEGIEVRPSDKMEELKILAFSPKRNAVRKELANIVNDYKRKNRNFVNYMNERLSASIEDNTFQDYPSFSEVFYMLYDKHHNSGRKTPEECINLVLNELNKVISSVFDEYVLMSKWDVSTNAPSLAIKKKDVDIPLESLSSGEQEVMSLIVNLYASKESADVILIDEPEIHLNWDLEQRLFSYFVDFAHEFKKQLVIATHSRMIFHSSFAQFSSFLFWDDGKIRWDDSIPDHEKVKIAGEAINVIGIGDISNKTLFVEDDFHVKAVRIMSELFGSGIEIVDVKNCQNVKSFFILNRDGKRNEKLFFLVDGDNQGNEFPGEDKVIHLDKYCMENYFLNISISARILGKTESACKEDLLEIIKENAEKVARGRLFIQKALMKLTAKEITQDLIDTYDGSILLRHLLKRNGKRIDKYVRDYCEYCNIHDLFDKIMHKQLIAMLTG